MSNLENLAKILATCQSELQNVNDFESLKQLKARYLGKKSELVQAMRVMATLSHQERIAFGKAVNEIKIALNDLFNAQVKQINATIINQKIAAEKIDVTLPGINIANGKIHPLNLVLNDILNFFMNRGYQISEGHEIEEDVYNFEKLNLAKDHPARDMQDSFYINSATLLRTHCTANTIRELEKTNNHFKIVSFGNVYRRDSDDATHSHQFSQVDIVNVGPGISFANLKWMLLEMCQYLFGQDVKIRLRPSYFPFTEPSVEVDIFFRNRWIEILGAGMLHPNVLTEANIDAQKFQSFAAGIGIERIAMIKYNVTDIREFYNNNVAFLKKFY